MAIADNMPNDRPGDDMRRIADLERAVRELRAARTLDQATITAAAGLGVRTSDFDGTDFAHPGTVGNYFGGDGAILNALKLRPGSVTNDELTSPVVPGVVNAVATNITVSAGTWGTVASQAVTVPAGCTQLLAHVTGSVYSVNPNTTGGTNGTGGDILEARAGVGSVDGLGMAVSISGSNGQTSVTATVAALLTGLTPGSSVTLRTQAMSGLQDFGANATSQANSAATLLWLR